MGDGWEEKVKDGLHFQDYCVISLSLLPCGSLLLTEDTHFLSTHTPQSQWVSFLSNIPLSSFSGVSGSENETGEICAAAEVSCPFTNWRNPIILNYKYSVFLKGILVIHKKWKVIERVRSK